MSILKQYLAKIGVSSFQDLTEEEKETYQNWEETLSGRKITDEDVALFLDHELQTAITRLTEVDLPKETEIFRKMEVQFIRKIQAFLDGPKIEQAMLAKQLK